MGAGIELVALAGQGNEAVLSLAPVLDLRAAPALKADFLAAIADGRPLVVDAQAVEVVTTPCIQVILAAAQAVRQAGIPFRMDNPSEGVKAAFEDLGLLAALLAWTSQDAA